MTNLTVYDIEAKTIEEIADKHDTTVAEIIQAMVECFKDNNGEEYL